MKAYKVFDSDLTCRNFQYEVGKTFKHEGKIKLCGSGFHACLKTADCFNYYSFDPNNRVCEVELSGEIIHGEDKSVCSEITLIKELTWSDVLSLVNTGNGNSGNRNSGNKNSGNKNSGDKNSGNWNSGDNNSGDWNSGDNNSGDWNSGDLNSGNCNSGNCNSGCRNSGSRNSGDLNSGFKNSGDRNSGDRNSGDCNSGDWNSGNWNSGSRNSGNLNSGDWNSGHRNSGNWNSCNMENGYFNSKKSDIIRVFNKKCTREIWEKTLKPDFINNIILNEWISFNDMTDEEKKSFPNASTCYGYLKTYSYKEKRIQQCLKT